MRRGRPGNNLLLSNSQACSSYVTLLTGPQRSARCRKKKFRRRGGIAVENQTFRSWPLYQGNSQDKKHFGPPPNKLMPDAENMKTNLNIQFFGCSSRCCWRNISNVDLVYHSFCHSPCVYLIREQGTWKRLYQAHQNLEMNLR